MTKPKTTQEEPTKPQPTDEAGRALDQWGLPLSGPARIRALGGKPDPRADQATSPPAAKASGAAKTEKQQGAE